MGDLEQDAEPFEIFIETLAGLFPLLHDSDLETGHAPLSGSLTALSRRPACSSYPRAHSRTERQAYAC